MEITYSNSLPVEDYCFLRGSVGFYGIPGDKVKRALEKSDYVIKAAVDGAPAGMARYISDGTQVLVMDVAVHPDYQGKGIGKSLMEHIIHRIKETESGRILVNLITDSSKTGFYEKLGFHGAPGMRLFLEGKN